MNLNLLSDADLLTNTEAIVRSERESLTALLRNLREIERRRLFSSLGFPSLFEYVVKRLKYSEAEANSRISAMRLTRDVPEIVSQIENGTLNMTNLCMARRLFAKEKKAGRNYSADQKRQVLRGLENKTTREGVKILSAINPEMKAKHELTFDSIEDESLRAKLLAIKGHSDLSLPELLHKLCDMALKSPVARQVDSKAETRRRVWRRDQGRCTNCGSAHALQYDHIQPKAAGGEDTFENLRLLCANCNQRAAVIYYGRKKMGDHLRSPRKEYLAFSG
jgi:hypothetical protein